MDRVANQKSNFIVLKKYSNTRYNMPIKFKRQRLFGILKITIESQADKGEGTITNNLITRWAPKTNWRSHQENQKIQVHFYCTIFIMLLKSLQWFP